MRSLIALAALSFALGAYAQQPAPDANPRDTQMDPATKARIRLEGVPGGTGAHVPPEASGGASVGQGDQHRHSPPKPPDPQKDERRSEKKEKEQTAK
jgi:hypothetical protein